LEPATDSHPGSSTSTITYTGINPDTKFEDPIKGSVLRQVPMDNLELGDVVRIVPGGAPPTDGVVVASESSTFDESILTGESVPVLKSIGDAVFAGTICKSGVVDVRVDKLGGDTM
jgi:P-type E1-E2 ATPase